MSNRVVIDVDNVDKVFDASGKNSVAALQGIDLTIDEGEFVSLLGPSGCGKSTLLRVMADLTASTSGRIEVNEKSATQARQDRDYGMVFQQPGLFEWRSVLRNVELPLQVAGVAKEQRRQRAQKMLELVHLSDFERHFPWQLSGGMQQRVSIARALTSAPKILLMDEPLGALDEMNREYLQSELLRIWDSTKTTVVFVTHSISEAVFLSSRVVIMSPRPGRVAGVVEVDLPYPRTARTRTSPEFYDKVTEVRTALHAVLAETETV
ncbi:NitT/TauT family transport system ATP-binding protein [Spinactinospora alkalitolerans]|uniref:NitT/TauT family transport system ATP-binding protein n=1 Tax=Spinactinospora alkalitolerans TaxID=687207 RepID=A0A852TZB0_9ACTN|nr:ABC transporter ATP-binding protein [Spinactinospora alkalitolerans]NYE47130.1 NitT/TauT family transport system ATP-binding protein [Spinactinospora alkalitolerans]